MKKSLLSAVAMLLACCGAANASVDVTAVNVPQPVADTLLFQLPVTPGLSQEIWTTYDDPMSGNHLRPTKYQPEYLVTALDFTKGDTDKGTATLPANAKVIGLGLDGYLQACDDENNCAQSVTAWCRNIPRDKMILDKLDLWDGYNTVLPQGDLFTDINTYIGYQNIGGYMCPIDVNSDENNLCSIVEIPFGNPDDPSMPFWYKGENIYLTLWLVNHYNPAWDGGTHIEYHYMAYDDAEVEYASLMRSGGYCFNSLSAEMLLTYFGMELMYELPRHRLPAFRTPYYTNDVRVDLLEADAVIELQDPEGNILGSAEDGNFYSLDHTQSYVLLVDGEASGVINFDNIYTDINVEVRKDFTAIEEIDANKAVASVVYYNLAGQQSEQPLDGVNIVVTTYTDGTRSTAKVIK